MYTPVCAFLKKIYNKINIFSNFKIWVESEMFYN